MSNRLFPISAVLLALCLGVVAYHGEHVRVQQHREYVAHAKKVDDTIARIDALIAEGEQRRQAIDKELDDLFPGRHLPKVAPIDYGAIIEQQDKLRKEIDDALRRQTEFSKHFEPSLGVDETCPKQANGVDVEKPLLYVRICGWHDDPKGGQCIYIKPDGVNDVFDLFWFDSAVNNTVVITNWFTLGKDAQAIRADKIEAAWKDRTPGVFKMERDSKILNNLFPGKTVE